MLNEPNNPHGKLLFSFHFFIHVLVLVNSNFQKQLMQRSFACKWSAILGDIHPSFQCITGNVSPTTGHEELPSGSAPISSCWASLDEGGSTQVIKGCVWGGLNRCCLLPSFRDRDFPTFPVFSQCNTICTAKTRAAVVFICMICSGSKLKLFRGLECKNKSKSRGRFIRR